MIYSCDIGITAEIPNDCVFHHSALGVVIGNGVKMGNRCQIYSNVCIGVKGRKANDGDPCIGNDVVIGTGSIILGGYYHWGWCSHCGRFSCFIFRFREYHGSGKSCYGKEKYKSLVH